MLKKKQPSVDIKQLSNPPLLHASSKSGQSNKIVGASMQKKDSLLIQSSKVHPHTSSATIHTAIRKKSLLPLPLPLFGQSLQSPNNIAPWTEHMLHDLVYMPKVEHGFGYDQNKPSLTAKNIDKDKEISSFLAALETPASVA